MSDQKLEWDESALDAALDRGDLSAAHDIAAQVSVSEIGAYLDRQRSTRQPALGRIVAEFGTSALLARRVDGASRSGHMISASALNEVTTRTWANPGPRWV